MTKSAAEMQDQVEPDALSGRWTICAMLFVATTINYVDRQVLSILKPVLAGSVLHLQPLLPGWPSVEASINLTDIQYGNILAAFQLAYALGVVFAGRLVDRLGCRRGYPIVTGLWSLAAMGHALVTSVSGFAVARFLLGLGESGNFPAAIKATAEWFHPKERAFATGIFNSGAGVGAILAPLTVPWVALHFGWRASFLVTGVFSATWIVWWSIRYRTHHKAAPIASTTNVPVKPAAPSIALWHLLRYRQTWGFMAGKFLTDPVWWFFLFLAASVFQLALQARPLAYWTAAGHCLRDFHVRQRFWRWMAAPWLHPSRNVAQDRTARGDADLCVPGGAHRCCGRVAFGLARGGPAEPCGCGAPGMVGEYLYDCFGYVSRAVCGDSG